MKNLFILGSPRENGNSTTMARTVGSHLQTSKDDSIEYVYLNNLTIQPCQGCDACNKTGQCIIEDDMQLLYAKTEEADRIFLVSPIYFYSVTAQLKTYIDRCQAQWAKKYILKQSNTVQVSRSGYLLSCAATNGKRLFDGAELVIKCLCDTLDIQYGRPLLIRGAEEANAIKNNKGNIADCVAYSNDLLETANITGTASL